MAPPGMEEMTSQLQNMFSNMGRNKKTTRKISVKDAMKQIKEEEAAKLINDERSRPLPLKQLSRTVSFFSMR